MVQAKKSVGRKNEVLKDIYRGNDLAGENKSPPKIHKPGSRHDHLRELQIELEITGKYDRK